MLKKRIGCLPVLDGDALVGLLSETDCLRYLARVLELPEIKDRRVGSEGGRAARNGSNQGFGIYMRASQMEET